jgi:hypothetical protein
MDRRGGPCAPRAADRRGAGLAAKKRKRRKNRRTEFCHRGHGVRTQRKQETDEGSAEVGRALRARRIAEVGRALRARQIAGVGRKKAQRAQKSEDGVLSQRSRSADTEEAGDGGGRIFVTEVTEG